MLFRSVISWWEITCLQNKYVYACALIEVNNLRLQNKYVYACALIEVNNQRLIRCEENNFASKISQSCSISFFFVKPTKFNDLNVI